MWQTSFAKVKRYYVSCFNVDPVFADSFKFPKSKGSGEFTINYMFASLNKEATAGEFFFEFDEYVWEHKLMECFNKLGAGQVSIVTFQNMDANESASNALLRLHTQPKNVVYERGTCPPALHAKLQAKLAEHAKKTEAGARELDEKTQLAIKQSLADLGGKVETLDIKVETANATVVQMDSKIDLVQNGVCTIIPDYQKEIEQLSAKLAHKTREVDRIEGQKGRLTHRINELTALKEGLERQLQSKTEELDRKTIEWQLELASLMEQVNLCKAIEEAKQIKDFLESDRELKRPRAM